ncbi:ABC transporter permease [Sedimentibacter sp. zth1]|uniref:ABC transporter permease n=1 Tax=Sedimentibacter sp. zth1 TaxID=2816908 RepID=UPI001A90E9A2|nr:ABC transporter permease [Sedimentibacter sp. zth1]QSX04728.1 ABC transporter permease [Sedimentibacter sp. zth1]
MFRYIIKRLVYLIFVFFMLSVILFGVFKMIPSDPARSIIDIDLMNEDPVKYEEAYQEAREKLGLNEPIYRQYANWMVKMLHGDFGYSIQYRQPIKQIIKQPLINTAKLNLVSFVFVFLISIPLGITTAVKRYSKYDNTIQLITVIGVSIPSFIIALIAIYIFSVKLHIFPINGMKTIGKQYTGIKAGLDSLHHMALPLIVMFFTSLASTTRYVRAAMIEVLKKDFIRTARAKGLSEKIIIYLHAFKNALIPIVTVFTWWFVGMFGGSIVIENIFLWNGIGKILIDSLKQQDYSLVLVINMFYILLSLLGNIVMDIGYMIVDPRVKLL